MDFEKIFARVEPTGFCWHWTGGLNNCGYGQVGFNGRTTPAHRAVYELLVGPIPKGLQLDHLCHVRICVNPDHLEPVTKRENMLRAGRRNGWVAGGKPREVKPPKTRLSVLNREVCRNGHVLDASVRYEHTTPKGQRVLSCKPCKRESECRNSHAVKGCPKTCSNQFHPRVDTRH